MNVSVAAAVKAKLPPPQSDFEVRTSETLGGGLRRDSTANKQPQ
jgi:hypothetical protein